MFMGYENVCNHSMNLVIEWRTRLENWLFCNPDTASCKTKDESSRRILTEDSPTVFV